MTRNQFAPWKRWRCRPQVERLEGRSQPGSLFMDLADWSILGVSLDLAAVEPAPLPAVESPAAATAARMLSLAEGSTKTEFLTLYSSAGDLQLVPAATHSGQDLQAVVNGLGAEDGGPGVTKYDGTWYALADMPTRRQEVATAVFNGEIYVLGGFNPNGQPTNTVEVYNPKTDSWRSAAPLPIVNDHGSAATVAGLLLAFGGRSNRVFAYNPDKDSWYDLAPMHYQHGGTAAVAVIGEYLYVAGGNGSGMVGNEAEVYDPYGDTWYVMAPMNVPRNHTAGGAIDGLFYVAGGRGTAQSGAAFEVYDPTQDSWTTLPNLPTPRSGVAGAVAHGCLYIFGGEIPGVFSEVEVYDPNTGEWQAATPMPTPRHGIFASVIDNAIYIPGGANREGFGAVSTNEVFVVG